MKYLRLTVFGLCLGICLPAQENPKVATVTAALEKSSDEASIDATPSAISEGEKAFWQALQKLQSNDPAAATVGRDLLKTAADMEFPHAQTLLANCYLTGSNGFKNDPKRAAALFRLAAERGNAFAQISYGQCLLTGTGTRTDKVRAAEFLSAALKPDANFARPTPPADFETNSNPANSQLVIGEQASDPVATAQASAHYLLGLLASEQKDAATAHTHFLAAANAGIAGRDGIYAAAVQAALDYAFGRGTSRDLKQASLMLEQSRKLETRRGVSLVHNYSLLKIVDEFAVADLEQTIADQGEANQQSIQLDIAETLNDKKSKDYNPQEAVKWYELAANNGHVWAMLNLAFIYANGTLGTPDYEKALAWFEKAGAGNPPKHYLGAGNLGIFLYRGIGTKADPARANALFAQYKNDDIICYLGHIGQCPDKSVTFEQALELLKLWAEKKKDPHAQYLLGLRYEYGHGVKPSLKQAMSWYKRAAEKKHPAANFRIGYLYQNYWREFDLEYLEYMPKALKFYTIGAEGGNADALAAMGYCYTAGMGIKRNSSTAQACYEKCLLIDASHAQANNNLANILLEQARKRKGAEAGPLTAKALQLYEAASTQGLALASLNLAHEYKNGTLVPADQQKAYAYFEKAADQGSPDAHYLLGQIHEKGEGVPITLSEAAYHYRLAALDRHSIALDRLCEIYLASDSSLRDLDRGIFWLSLKAQQGNIFTTQTTLRRLGDVCMMKKDYATALKIFTDLLDNGWESLQIIAAHRLSVLYENGWGVKKNTSKASRYRERARKAGNPPAMYDTALIYLREGNEAKAIQLLTEASKKSHAPALFKLAMINFKNGTASEEQTNQLISKAADAGSDEALITLATQTLEQKPGAPSIEDAIQFASRAVNIGNAQAGEILSKLEKLQQSPPLSRP